MSIKIIGTDHLMSKEEIYNIIEYENPDIIGVELCKYRYDLMVIPKINNLIIPENNNQDGTIISKISNAIKKKADENNLEYGSDQINSCIYAIENNINLEFLDLDIIKTKELMEKIPQEEMTGFLKEIQEFEQMSIDKVKEDAKRPAEELLLEMKIKYPIAFEFLINYRNLFIANKILQIIKNNPNKKILIILGKGHINQVKLLIGGEE